LLPSAAQRRAQKASSMAPRSTPSRRTPAKSSKDGSDASSDEIENAAQVTGNGEPPLAATAEEDEFDRLVADAEQARTPSVLGNSASEPAPPAFVRPPLAPSDASSDVPSSVLKEEVARLKEEVKKLLPIVASHDFLEEERDGLRQECEKLRQQARIAVSAKEAIEIRFAKSEAKHEEAVKSLQRSMHGLNERANNAEARRDLAERKMKDKQATFMKASKALDELSGLMKQAAQRS